MSSIYRESRLWRDAVIAFAITNTAKQAIAHAGEVVEAYKKRFGDKE